MTPSNLLIYVSERESVLNRCAALYSDSKKHASISIRTSRKAGRTYVAYYDSSNESYAHFHINPTVRTFSSGSVALRCSSTK